MSNDFIAYRWDPYISPSWMARPNGLAWHSGFGQIENNFLLTATLGAQARFPSLAPAGLLQYVGNDRQLLPPYDDNPNQDAYRAYLATGFSQGVAGTTLAWMPLQAYSTNALVGATGLVSGGTSGASAPNAYVWQCMTAGISGDANPFPSPPATVTPGQLVSDGTVVWQLTGAAVGSTASSPSPTAPLAPGWYFSGTDVGLIAALVNSGFYATAPDGSVIPPRIITNRELVAQTGSGTGVVTVASSFLPTPTTPWVRPDSAPHVVVVQVITGGTAGALGGQVTVSVDGAPAVTVPTVGIPYTYQQLAANGASVQVTFSGVFATGATYTSSPPDGRTGAWARMWLVVPSENVIGHQYTWGPSSWAVGKTYAVGSYVVVPAVSNTFSTYQCTHAGGAAALPAPSGTGTSTDGGGNVWQHVTSAGASYDGQWGRPAAGSPTVAQWGAGVPLTSGTTYGLLHSILQRWSAAHVRVIGAWMATGTSTEITWSPTAAWNESFNVRIVDPDPTIGTYIPAFFRFNQTTPGL
jgi:hypothetical protein